MDKKFLFVCLGNICRSPAAETVFSYMARERGYSCEVDSAGTYGGHAGQKADSRMRQAAGKRGYDITSCSRQVRSDDFYEFDYIIAMDDRNYDDLWDLAPDLESQAKLYKMRDFCTKGDVQYVPDPYYEGREGFELVLDILEDGCDNLLNELMEK